MMNGALTIGTRDGATIEMAAGGGRGKLLPLRLDGGAGDRQPRHGTTLTGITNTIRKPAQALDLIFSDYFSRDEPGVFEPLRDMLLTHGDHYMHLADLKSYLDGRRAADARYMPIPTSGRAKPS